MADSLDKELDVLSQHLNFKVKIGYLGDGSGSGNPRVLDNSGRLWARRKIGNRYTAPVAYPVNPNASIPPNDNVAVEIGILRGVETIIGIYVEGFKQSGENPGVTNPSDPQARGDVQSDYITQFQCKRHADTVNKPLTVVVGKGYLEINGVSYVFFPTEVNLTSYVPASGAKRIACIYLKTDLTLEVFASTSKLLIDPILAADIDECRQQATSGSMSIWGWVLQDGQTILTEDIEKNIDLRPIFTPPASTIDYFPINLTTSLTIPTNKQVVTGSFTISSGGVLTVNGKVTIV